MYWLCFSCSHGVPFIHFLTSQSFSSLANTSSTSRVVMAFGVAEIATNLTYFSASVACLLSPPFLLKSLGSGSSMLLAPGLYFAFEVVWLYPEYPPFYASAWSQIWCIDDLKGLMVCYQLKRKAIQIWVELLACPDESKRFLLYLQVSLFCVNKTVTCIAYDSWAVNF